MMPLLTAFMQASQEGIPLPYTPRQDDWVSVLLLGCFFVSAYVLTRSRKFLAQLLKDFLLHRERTSLFATSTPADVRGLLLLVLQTCLLGGTCLFCYFVESNPALTAHLSPLLLLGIYIAICFLFLCIKWLLYSFLGWIFFDEGTTSLWLESFLTLLYYLGFALFPVALVMVFFNWSLQVEILLGLSALLFTKILIFYKWLKLFCSNLHGCLYLFLYFCALEIVPCLILYQGMIELNEYMIIKI